MSRWYCKEVPIDRRLLKAASRAIYVVLQGSLGFISERFTHINSKLYVMCDVCWRYPLQRLCHFSAQKLLRVRFYGVEGLVPFSKSAGQLIALLISN